MIKKKTPPGTPKPVVDIVEVYKPAALERLPTITFYRLPVVSRADYTCSLEGLLTHAQVTKISRKLAKEHIAGEVDGIKWQA
jgi:hypothetical protein